MNPLVNKRCSPIEEMIYQDGFQAGAASRDAEIQRLQMALADAEALELGTAEKCDQLRAELVPEGTEMTMPKFEPVAWLRDTLDGGLSTMTDCCTNVVKEIWLKANPKNVERYTAPLYTADQLTEAYEAGKREQASELEAARAEIERLKTVPMKYRRMAFNAHLQDENAKLNKQLAAEQAKNTGLRDALKSAVDTIEWMYGCTSPADDEVEKAIVAGNNALSTPSDTAVTPEDLK